MSPLFSQQSPLIVMVVGAGRGPLVQACIDCSIQTDVPVKLFAVEKNPSAATVLRILNRDSWDRQVSIICIEFVLGNYSLNR